MANASIPLTINAEAVAAIADLADAAQGIRTVLEKLDTREEQREEEDRKLTPGQLNEYWADLHKNLPREVADGLFDWLNGSEAPAYTWSLFKIAQHYHWSR